MPLADEVLYPLLRQMGQFGVDHAKARIGHPPGSPEHLAAVQARLLQAQALPVLPSLPALPSLQQAAAAAGLPIPTQPAPQPPAGDAGGSYAAEWDDLSVACKPCTVRHLATMTEAARSAAEARDAGTRRENLAIWAAEGRTWLQYDVTPEKLARASEGDRQAISDAAEAMHPIIDGAPQAPDRLVRAWGACGEAMRFAQSANPRPADLHQVELRMRDVDGWVGYLEASPLRQDPEAAPHLRAIREARHRWNREGYTPGALAQAEAALRAAAVGLTPDPGPEQARLLHQQTKAVRDRFYAAAVRGMGVHRPADRWILDRDCWIPRRWGGSDLPQGGLMGATPQTVAAWHNLLKFASGAGITVRERQLPAEVGFVVKGAFNPATNAIVLGPAATAEDSDGLQTLVHELSHALLHNPACLPVRTADYAERYEESQEEIEADAATFLFMADLGIPIEEDDATGYAPPSPDKAREAVRESIDAPMAARAMWASGILSTAARTGTATGTGECPPA